MPAETHQLAEPPTLDDVVDLLASLLDADPASASATNLVEAGVDDELALLHLWKAVAEEYGERTLGECDLDFDENRPQTLEDLARAWLSAQGVAG
ncbi:MAG: hypothetical protein U5K29_09855 [Acidimicrobiales bacterium]|nr:hypothetical protein [Acidimicrobiales bacterium]